MGETTATGERLRVHGARHDYSTLQRLAGGVVLCVAIWGSRPAVGNELLQQRPLLNPRTMLNANPLGEGVAMLTTLATRLQDHGYKALIRAVNLPRGGQVEVIDTGVNGADVQLAAVPCDTADGGICLLSLKVTFSDPRQVLTDAFCTETTRKLSLARIIPVVGQDGRKAANMVYALMYQGDPDIQLVEAALRLFGADADRFRNAYRDAMNAAAK